MASRYSGAWKTLNTTPYVSPNLTGSVPDQHHVTPETEDNIGWQQSTPSLGFPSLDNQSYATDFSPVGFGSAEPLNHDYGIGIGAGLTDETAIAENTAAHNTDLGTVAALDTVVPFQRDGTYHIASQREPDFMPGSPGSLELQQTSRPEVSPNARRATFVKRYFDRVFDYRRFEVDHRPRFVSTAYEAPISNAVVNGNQYTSPFPTSVSATVNNQTIVPPDTRQVPTPWDESFDTGLTTGSGSEFFSGGL